MGTSPVFQKTPSHGSYAWSFRSFLSAATLDKPMYEIAPDLFRVCQAPIWFSGSAGFQTKCVQQNQHLFDDWAKKKRPSTTSINNIQSKISTNASVFENRFSSTLDEAMLVTSVSANCIDATMEFHECCWRLLSRICGQSVRIMSTICHTNASLFPVQFEAQDFWVIMRTYWSCERKLSNQHLVNEIT